MKICVPRGLINVEEESLDEVFYILEQLLYSYTYFEWAYELGIPTQTRTQPSSCSDMLDGPLPQGGSYYAPSWNIHRRSMR